MEALRNVRHFEPHFTKINIASILANELNLDQVELVHPCG